MTETDVVAELRKLIGITTQPVINEVERGAIRRYAEAVGDDNPLYTDVAHAMKSRYGEILCPPGFFGWPMKVSDAVMEVMGAMFGTLFKAGFFRILDGGREYDFYLPIRAGDTLTWYARFADVAEREGKSGKMVILTTELVYLNQNGDLVAKARPIFIARK